MLEDIRLEPEYRHAEVYVGEDRMGPSIRVTQHTLVNRLTSVWRKVQIVPSSSYMTEDEARAFVIAFQRAIEIAAEWNAQNPEGSVCIRETAPV